MKQMLTVQSDYRKTQVPVDDIAYITVADRKTKITRSDGSFLRTNRSLKDVYAQLPEDMFSNINRGIVVSKKYVREDKDGCVTMEDGTKFKRRVRNDRIPKRQKRPRQEPPHSICPAETLSQWLDGVPMPMLILELVHEGGGVDLLIRYLSRDMAQLECVTAMEVTDQSVLHLSNLGNPKWMTIFADVAIHGGSKVIEDVLENSGKYMQLRCYQPQPGFCACVLMDLTKENNLIQELFRKGTR